jgi:tetratricopeptide (TPR) repeat protein
LGKYLSGFLNEGARVIDKEKILGIAQKYILKGQSKKAINEYLKLIGANPEDKRLHLKLGDLYLKNGENEKAIHEYLKVAELYTAEELNFRAISIYKKILSIDHKSLEAFQKIAELYLKEGLAGSAKNYYQGILQIDPGNQDALKALDNLEGQRGSKGASGEDLSGEPSPSKVHLLVGEESGEKRTSSPPPPINPTGLANISEVSPPDKDSEMHYHLGIAYKEMELLDYAISEFEQACPDPSIQFDCYIMLGNCYMEKGDLDKSIECYRMALAVEGFPEEKLARLQFNLGLAYEAKGMIEEAIDTFSQVLRLDHRFAEAQERLKKLQPK